MKFYSIIGTRPNFVKEFLINKECKKRGIDELIVHTGQHYDYAMSKIFFEEFELPRPDHYLDIKNESNLDFTAQAISRLGQLFQDQRPDFVLSYGDVNTTLASAVAATKLAIPFVHVEGGIRSSDLYNPEEINRRVADVLAEVIYCCTITDVHNLEREGYNQGRFVLSGDLMKDALLSTLKEHSIELSRGDYMVLTLHRQENTANCERLEAIVDGLIDSGQRIIFPAHPRTLQQLERFDLIQKLVHSKVEVIKPMGYLEFVKLTAGANKILTDSGGVRREAYLMKKPCIVLINLSWFPEISKAGWKVLTEPDSKRISFLINNFEPKGEHVNIFGDGRAYVNILDDLEKRFT